MFPIANAGFFKTQDAASNDIIFSVTVGAADSFRLPTLISGTYSFDVDWGDENTDTITVWNQSEVTHDYTTAGAGTYDITITGVYNGWSVNNYADRLKITEIKQWGNILGIGAFAFTGASNMTITATDIPDMSGTTTLNAAFGNCSSITSIPNMGSWNMSNVTDLRQCFRNCTNFNENINGWNTSSLTVFVSGTEGCFEGCSSFNSPLDNWDVSGVSLFNNLFEGCTVFNQDLTSWNTSSMTTASSMFLGCTAFNGDVTGFDVSGVSVFTSMFQNCSNFNQNISGWTTSSATNFVNMFRNATSFNQNLGGWDVSGVTTANNMFFGNNVLSTANYSSLLIGWAAQTVQSGVPFSANTATYTIATAQASRDILTNAPNNWTITDGGGV